MIQYDLLLYCYLLLFNRFNINRHSVFETLYIYKCFVHLYIPQSNFYFSSNILNIKSNAPCCRREGRAIRDGQGGRRREYSV